MLSIEQLPIDSSPTLVAAFRDRFPEVPVQCDTVLESNYFQRKFDAAIAIGLIFLLDRPAQINMLHRVAEILHPGAKFLFTAPVEVGRWTDQITGLTCLSLGRSAYESVLQCAGFRLIATDEDAGHNNYYAVEKVIDRAAADAV